MRKVQEQDAKLNQVDGITETFKFLTDEYKESVNRQVSGDGPYRNNTDATERARASKEDGVKRTEEAAVAARGAAEAEARDRAGLRAAGAMAEDAREAEGERR